MIMVEERLYSYVRQSVLTNEFIRIVPVKLKDKPLVRGKVVIKRENLTVIILDEKEARHKVNLDLDMLSAFCISYRCYS